MNRSECPHCVDGIVPMTMNRDCPHCRPVLPPPPAEQASGELSHAIDLMRDVYMSKAQREAYDRILTAALNLEPRND